MYSNKQQQYYQLYRNFIEDINMCLLKNIFQNLVGLFLFRSYLFCSLILRLEIIIFRKQDSCR